MNWVAFGLLNMGSLTILRLYQKAFVIRFPSLNTFRLNWISMLVGLPVFIYLVFSNITTITHLPTAFWVTLTAVVIGFYPLGNYLYFSVIRENELSNVLPLLGFVPILTALYGWLILGQTASHTALFGIVCICLSIYFLRADSTGNWIQPIKSLAASKSARALFLASNLTALAAIGDKYAIEKSSASIYFAFNSIGAILVLFICDVIFEKTRKKSLLQEVKRLPKQQLYALTLLGIIFVAVQIIGFTAVFKAANTSYIIAIRNINIVVASAIAIVLYKESLTKNKLLCYGLSAVGIVMIAL